MNSKKSWRALTTSLLIVLLVTTGNGGSFFAKRTASAAQEANDETKITAEEESEAREIAERFMRRMGETPDLAPLVGEMFVPDYAARLRQEASNKPLALLSRDVAADASREELSRYQLALNNGFYLACLILLAHKISHPAESEDEEEGLAYYQRALPPDIIELCKNDPILKVMFEEATDERAEENPPGVGSEKSDAGEADADPIRSIEQLRGFTSTLEQAGLLARKHLAALPFKFTFADRHKGANEEENWTAERETLKPRAWTLTRESYGYPIGTRIFCVNVLIYHMDLIRVDGKLKALALYPEMD